MGRSIWEGPYGKVRMEKSLRKGEQAMTRRALAYTHDVILGRTGELISRAVQKEGIREYAQEHDIEISGWFEDEVYEENPLKRPGILQILSCEIGCDCVLVERVWCLSRRWSVLRPLIDELDANGKRIESASWLWDCVSVIARHYCRDKERSSEVSDHMSVAQKRAAAEMLPRPAEHKSRIVGEPGRSGRRRRHAIRKPDKLHFEHLLKRHG